MRPTLVHRRDHPQGEQILSAQAAQTARMMLRGVVTRGTARAAEVEGYDVAGKTGTADKPRPGGGYYESKVISNFAAMFPVESPKYVLVVTLDEPSVTNAGGGTARTAGLTAAPVAAEMVRRLAPIVGLRPAADADLPVIENRTPADLKLVTN